MHLNEETFQDLKLIPLSLIIGVQKFAVDIDVNSLTKGLGRDRYAIGNRYFVVVDQEGKARRIRLGLRLMIFRGTYGAGGFI